MSEKTKIQCDVCRENLERLPESHDRFKEGKTQLYCPNQECEAVNCRGGKWILPDDCNGLDLDLFCGVGGVARALMERGRGGYSDVIGIELDGSKADKYPGYFIEHDLSEGLPEIVKELRFDIAWASPPCQAFTNVQYARSGKNLIPLARDLLQDVECSFWVIENVPDAKEHLNDPAEFCGSAFDLGIKKHRVFETSFECHSLECDHPRKFKFCIGDREAPVTEYREAHGLHPQADIRTKQVRECIPVAYVEELWDQYEVSCGGKYLGSRETGLRSEEAKA